MAAPSVLLAILLADSPARAGEWAVPEPAWETYQLAIAALDGQDPGLGEKLATRALKKAKGDCDPCLATQGQALMLQDRPAEAWDLFAPLVGRHPDNVELLVAAGFAAFAAKHFDDARNLGLAAVTHAPDDPSGHGLLLQAHMRLGSTDEARLVLSNATRTLPTGTLSCLEARLALEEERWTEALDLANHCADPAEQQMIWYNASLHADIDEATRAKLADTIRNRSGSLQHRATQLLGEGRYEEAIALLDQARAEGREQLNQVFVRVAALEALNRQDEALAELDVALEREDWIQVQEGGSMIGILTAGALEDFEEQQAQGAIWRAILLEESGRSDEADAAAATASRLSGTPTATPSATAWLVAARGEPAAAWAGIEALGNEWLSTHTGGWLTVRMANRWGEHMPDTVLARLDDAALEAARSRRDYVQRVAAEHAAVDAHNAVVDAYNLALADLRTAQQALPRAGDQVEGGDAAGCLATLDELEATVTAVDPELAAPLSPEAVASLAQARTELLRNAAGMRFACLVATDDAPAARAWRDANPDVIVPWSAEWNLLVLEQAERGPEQTRALLEALCAGLDGSEQAECRTMLGG